MPHVKGGRNEREGKNKWYVHIGILRAFHRAYHRRTDREVGVMKQEVFSITALEQMGYPKQLLRSLIHSEDFSSIGFRLASSRNSKTFFYKEKLDKFLAHQEDERQGAMR